MIVDIYCNSELAKEIQCSKAAVSAKVDRSRLELVNWSEALVPFRSLFLYLLNAGSSISSATKV